MERKYYCYGIKPLNYGFSLFNFYSKSINKIYFYEENNKFFEFFTGTELIRHSTMYCNNTRETIFLSLPESSDFFIYIIDTDFTVARMLTVSDFVNAIKPLMKDEEDIKCALLNFFKQKHQEWLKK